MKLRQEIADKIRSWKPVSIDLLRNWELQVIDKDGKIAQLEADNAALKQKVKSREVDNAALQQQVRTLDHVIETYKEDHARYAEEITNLCSQLDTLDKQVKRLTEMTRGASYADFLWDEYSAGNMTQEEMYDKLALEAGGG